MKNVLIVIILITATFLTVSAQSETETRSSLTAESNLAPPANDSFANADILLTSIGDRDGTNVDATKQAGEPNHGGNPGGRSVWYKRTISQNVGYVSGFTVTVRRNSTDFDTLLAVYTGSSVNALTKIAENDDYGSTPSALTSTVYFPAVPGATYYIAVDGYGAASGNFMLGWNINQTHAESSEFAGNAFWVSSVFRPSDGTWYSQGTSSFQSFKWGVSGDIPAPADFDGDLVTDYCVFRPSNGTWYVWQSRTNTPRFLTFGLSGDKPVPGDYDGNGYADFAVFRPSNGTWYVTKPPFNLTVQFGVNGDKPVPRDFDVDGKLDLVLFRPSTGTWYILHSKDNSVRIQQWGISEDTPVPSGYFPTGRADIAVWRPSTGTWFVYSGHNNQLVALNFGQNGDIPQPINYGNYRGTSDFAVFRPSNRTWYIQEIQGPSTYYEFPFGLTGDIPTATAYPIQQ